jgi:hypothetical protein
VIPTLPLAARDRLAALVLAAVGDAGVRASLGTLADEHAAAEWLGASAAGHAALASRRAAAAATALAALPAAPVRSLPEALAVAAALVDAGLGFEAHEVLEPYWAREEGEPRETLQGLIQIAVGYQHAANGNLAGARMLLAEGAARVAPRRLSGLPLDGFAQAVRASLKDPAAPGRPRFPRPASPQQP